MKTIQEMKQERHKLVLQMRSMIDKVDLEKRNMSTDENTEYDKLGKEVDDLSAAINKREKLAEIEKTMESRNSEYEQNKGTPGKKQDIVATAEYRDAFKQNLINPSELSDDQRKLLNERRAQSAVTGTAGGYTVPQSFHDKITDAMKFYGGIRQARTTILRTAGGNDMPVPTANDTAVVGELLGENAVATTGDVAFGQVILKAYKYSSKVVLVPFELLQDSAFDIESYIASKLGERIGRITNTHFTTGDNASKPQGIVTASVLGKTGTTGQTTSIIYDDLIDLIHSVDPAYRTSAEFMFHDSTLKALKKLKDGQQRPLWLPGLADKEPDTIAGYPYVINNDMPVMAANAKSVVFGDMKNYFVRDVMDIQVFRISDKYIEAGQVGFLAFYRGDGRMVDAGMNPVKHYANSAT